MILVNRFQTLPIPLARNEHAKLDKKIAAYSARPNNAEVLGAIFKRLVGAFEFEWAMRVFDLISRHDKKTGKFSEHLHNVAEVFVQYESLENISKVQDLIIECLKEGWKLHTCIGPFSKGFARRADAESWFEIWDDFRKRVTVDNDEPIVSAIETLINYDNRRLYPFATDAYILGIIARLTDKSSALKWEDRLEDRSTIIEQHEERLELIFLSTEAARESDQLGRGYAEAITSLIKLDECDQITPLLREATGFPSRTRTEMIAKLRWADADHINSRAAVLCAQEFVFAEHETGTLFADHFAFLADVAESSLKLGLLPECLQSIERMASRFDRDKREGFESVIAVNIAQWIISSRLSHVPRDFWKALIDSFRSPGVRAALLAKLAGAK